MSFAKQVIKTVKGFFGTGQMAKSGGRGAVAISTGRKSDPNEYNLTTGPVGRQWSEFHNRNLTDLSAWDHKNILKILRSVSPEASLAITTFLRVSDSGYTITVRSMDGKIHEQGQVAALEMINAWEQPKLTQFNMPNSIRDLAQKHLLDCLVKGAPSNELVVDKHTIKATGIEYVDPWSIDFEWNKEERRWIPYQTQQGKKVILDIPTFFYIPVDPLGNDPYGEEQLTSAIRSIIFKEMVMQDLRMAIHTNGWNRLDFKILEEALIKNAPPEYNKPGNEKKLQDFIAAQLAEVINTYKALNPDDNIVHTDSIEVDTIQAEKGGMFNPKEILNVIDNQIANGLKTFSVLLSKKFGGGSEGFTSSEMILYIKLIGGFQSIVEDLFERALSLALRINYGIIAKVDFAFNKIELRSDLELSQWKSIEISNVISLYNNQAIGLTEMQARLREIEQFTGPVPDDILEERVIGNVQPNDAERPTASEEDKERRRVQTNRDRRSGRQS